MGTDSLDSVVTWWWSTPGYRSKYSVEHVNTLSRMVKRHYSPAHRFILVTNENTTGLDAGIEVVADRADFADVPPPRPGFPSCYRRLRMFEPNAHTVFGNRFVSLDLDCVITGDLRPVWDRPEDIVVWGHTNKANPYNMSMVLLRANSRTKVWTDFKPRTSPQLASAAGYFGSDQAWLCHVLGESEARWGKRDGVFSYVNDFRYQPQLPLPSHARIVFFHGHVDPWMPQTQRAHPWIVTHYR